MVNKQKTKKYIIVLIDGAADYKIKELQDKTPLQAAAKPNINNLAENGVVGLIKTIPDGMAPGSDTANLSVLGFDPLKYSTGRSSLEALSIGVDLSYSDITYRCNLVTLSEEDNFEKRKMIDYSAGEITTEEARILIKYLSDNLDINAIISSIKNNLKDLKKLNNLNNLYNFNNANNLNSYKIDSFFNDLELKFYPGISYRHVIVLKDISLAKDFSSNNFSSNNLLNKKKLIQSKNNFVQVLFNEFINKKLKDLTPPHDITGKIIGKYLPELENIEQLEAELLIGLMKESFTLLKEHPINKKRVSIGKNPANSIWIWARATKPNLDNFSKKFGINGVVISAVDLIRGIGVCAGLEPVFVHGATGNINTNFEGKAKAAVDKLKEGKEFAYIHIEAPDECSHQGNLRCKIKSIELIDQHVIRTIINEMNKERLPFRVMILPDHPTPIQLKTHTSEPVPFLIYDSEKKFKLKNFDDIMSLKGFDEESAKEGGIFINPGYKLIDLFLENNG